MVCVPARECMHVCGTMPVNVCVFGGWVCGRDTFTCCWCVRSCLPLYVCVSGLGERAGALNHLEASTPFI